MTVENNRAAYALPGEIIRGALLAAAIFFIGYSWLISDSLLHADAAEYIDDMESLREILHPVHLGYIVTGHFFLNLTSPLGQPDLAMNLLNLFWGAWTLFFLYLTAWQVTGKKSVSTIACLILAVNYTFVFNSVFAEIYIMQAGCLMAGLFFNLRHKYFFAGAFLSISVLTTPLSLLALPMFLVTDLRAKPILMLLAWVAVPLGLVLMLNPGYLDSGRFLMAADQPFIIQRQAMIEFNEITNGYFVLVPALLAGCFILFRTQNLKKFNLGIGLTFAANFFLGERYYDVPGTLFVLCLLSIAAAAGLALLLGSSDAKSNPSTFLRWASAAAIASFVSSLLTGLSVKIQRGMDAIPPFYIKTGIIVAGIWIGFAMLSRISGPKFVFIRQFTALALVVMLVFFNFKFTMVRTMEDRQLADDKKQAFACSQSECVDCRLVGNWNDIALFLHYNRVKDPELSNMKAWPLNGDLLLQGGPKAKEEFISGLQKTIDLKQGVILISDLPEVADWLLKNGYENYGSRDWKIFASPDNPPRNSDQKNCLALRP